MSRYIAAAAAAALVAAGAQTAGAQKIEQPAGAARTGFFAAAYVGGAGIKGEGGDAEYDTGGGASLQAGYAFRNNVSVFADLAAAKLDAEDLDGDYALIHFDVGARYAWNLGGGRWSPFVEGAVGVRNASAEISYLDPETDEPATGDLEMSGASFSLGGGTHYFLTPALGLSANLRASFGDFGTMKINGEEQDGFDAGKATTTRVNFGVVWFPGARK